MAKHRAQRTTLKASFAHHTVQEYFDSSRLENSTVFFTVHQEEMSQKFRGVVLSEAQHIELKKLWEVTDAWIVPPDVFGAVNGNLTIYSIVSAILSLCKWPTEIFQHKMLCSMAIDLFNPSNSHFESLSARPRGLRCRWIYFLSIISMLISNAGVWTGTQKLATWSWFAYCIFCS